MTKKKKKKVVYVDDGRTVFDMSGVSNPNAIFPSNPKSKDEKKKKNEQVGLTKKERWAAIKAAYLTYLPVLLTILAGFTITILLLALVMK